LAEFELPVEERETLDSALRQVDFLDGEVALVDRAIAHDTGRRASQPVWAAPSKPRASGSRATNCAASASSREPSTTCTPNSARSSPPAHRGCSPNPAAAC